MIKQISTHCFNYRGLKIIKLPPKALNPITRYHVMKNDDSFGKFDTMVDAIKYIDSLYCHKNKANIPTILNVLATRGIAYE